MKSLLISLLAISSLNISICAQEPPPKAKTIIVKGINYSQILEILLDKKIEIEKRDAELQTVRTGPIVYPRYYNGAYKMDIRVKDSTAYFSGLWVAPYETQFASLLVGSHINDPKWDNSQFIYNRCDRKGRPLKKSIDGYPFWLMVDFVKSLGKEVEYKTD